MVTALKKGNRKNILIIGAAVGAAFFVAQKIAENKTEPANINDDNPYIKEVEEDANGAKSHCESCPANDCLYIATVKPVFDRILSFCSLVILSPLMLVIAFLVWIDDPGPVFFTQKRVGKDKAFFMLHKYRTMRMGTPRDVPTHELNNPRQYITRTGRFLRASSLDELPQIWDIFRGRMSFIGPRPALWNQDDLVAERSKYGANNVLPGLTGLAQIKGRDELEIPVKAKLDGEYIAVLRKGGWQAAWYDCKMFFGTIKSVVKHDGVVEGGTGSLASSSIE